MSPLRQRTMQAFNEQIAWLPKLVRCSAKVKRKWHGKVVDYKIASTEMCQDTIRE